MTKINDWIVASGYNVCGDVLDNMAAAESDAAYYTDITDAAQFLQGIYWRDAAEATDVLMDLFSDIYDDELPVNVKLVIGVLVEGSPSASSLARCVNRIRVNLPKSRGTTVYYLLKAMAVFTKIRMGKSTPPLAVYKMVKQLDEYYSSSIVSFIKARINQSEWEAML